MTNKFSCEFCQEFARDESSRFMRIYRSHLTSRIILAKDNFIAIPTIGQIFPGSLLVLPAKHVERFADLGSAEQEASASFVDRLRLDSHQAYVLFEHGARSKSNGGCGIYHAHVHIVPVPSELSINRLLPSSRLNHSSFQEAWKSRELCDEYIVVRDSFGNVASVGPKEIEKEGFGSQYMRRALVEHFSVQKDWDWRKYNDPEKELIATVAARKAAYVS